MIKKICIGFFILLSLFLGDKNFVYSDKCNSKGTSICGTKFTIDMSQVSPLGSHSLKGKNDKSSKGTLNNILRNFIQKLMIVLGMIALFIMTIGAGYMIMYHGQDEYLTKGKNIFMAGIWSLVIALSSYNLISLIRFILYSE